MAFSNINNEISAEENSVEELGNIYRGLTASQREAVMNGMVSVPSGIAVSANGDTLFKFAREDGSVYISASRSAARGRKFDALKDAESWREANLESLSEWFAASERLRAYIALQWELLHAHTTVRWFYVPGVTGVLRKKSRYSKRPLKNGRVCVNKTINRYGGKNNSYIHRIDWHFHRGYVRKDGTYVRPTIVNGKIKLSEVEKREILRNFCPPDYFWEAAIIPAGLDPALLSGAEEAAIAAFCEVMDS